jgi:hypothetical protein
MAQSQPFQTAFRRGRAIVRIAGDTFVADTCIYDGRGVSFRGRVRTTVIERNGSAERVELGEPVDRTVPIGRIGSIEWAS